jgi:hypothetical protein
LSKPDEQVEIAVLVEVGPGIGLPTGRREQIGLNGLERRGECGRCATRLADRPRWSQRNGAGKKQDNASHGHLFCGNDLMFADKSRRDAIGSR